MVFKNVIYRSDLPNHPRDVVFRVLLFKLFNRISTWELLEAAHGPLAYSHFDQVSWSRTLEGALRRGDSVYSAAYIMPPATRLGYKRKHSNHLALLTRMMDDRIEERLLDARSMQEAYEVLRSYPYIGSFLAYQFVTDLNYSPVLDFSEMDFVVPGPGARSGLAKCFSDLRSIDFQKLWGRSLKLIDCQNLFCEVDKYARVRHPDVKGRHGRSQIKQTFSPSVDSIPFWYPPKWGINDAVAESRREVEAACTSKSIRN